MVYVFSICLVQVFTSVPPLAIGLFDRTVTSASMLKYPKLYKESQNAEIYNTKVRGYPAYFMNFMGRRILLGRNPASETAVFAGDVALQL